MTDAAPLARLAASLEPSWLAAQRWFAGKGRHIESLELVAGVEVGPGSALLVLDVRLSGAVTERYAVPIGEVLWPSLLRDLGSGARDGFELDWLDGNLPSQSERELGCDQSNTTYVLDERLALKCYRRLWPEPHPEVELVGWLSGRSPLVPRLRGTVTYRDPDETIWPVALLQEFVPDAEDGWAWGQAVLGAVLEGGRVSPRAVDWARPLGRELAVLQLALCELDSRPATPADREGWRQAALTQLDDALALVDRETAASLRALEPGIRAELDRFATLGAGLLARAHGDLHIGQVLRSEAGFHVVDFEGEPTRPPEERRALQSPLRDVASMLRSFEHLARWHRRDDPDPGKLALALEWARNTRAGFLRGWAEGTAGSALGVDHGLLRAFEVEKETYEFVYAARFLPEWTPIALASMQSFVASSTTV